MLRHVEEIAQPREYAEMEIHREIREYDANDSVLDVSLKATASVSTLSSDEGVGNVVTCTIEYECSQLFAHS